MEFINSFFEPGLLIYSVPLLFSLSIWSLALIGLFNFHIFNIDFHGHSGDIHTGHGGINHFLEILGFGKIPFSMLFTLICFFFGWTGLFIEKFGFITLVIFSKLFSILTSLIISLVLSAILVKPLQPFFKDYGKPVKADEIIGKSAIIRTNSVSDDFGSATVKLDGGIIVEISVRAQSKENSLKPGDQVLIIEHDSKNNIYFIEPFINLIEE